MNTSTEDELSIWLALAASDARAGALLLGPPVPVASSGRGAPHTSALVTGLGRVSKLCFLAVAISCLRWFISRSTRPPSLLAEARPPAKVSPLFLTARLVRRPAKINECLSGQL